MYAWQGQLSKKQVVYPCSYMCLHLCKKFSTVCVCVRARARACVRACVQDIAMSAMCMGEAMGQIKVPGLIDKQTLQEGRESLHFLVVCGRLLISSLSPLHDCSGTASRLFDVRCIR